MARINAKRLRLKVVGKLSALVRVCDLRLAAFFEHDAEQLCFWMIERSAGAIELRIIGHRGVSFV